jgi:hypothetical protein
VIFPENVQFTSSTTSVYSVSSAENVAKPELTFSGFDVAVPPLMSRAIILFCGDVKTSAVLSPMVAFTAVGCAFASTATP